MKSKFVLIFLSLNLALASSLSARVVELTPGNFETQSNRRPILVFLSLSCDAGSFAAAGFTQAFADLQGVDLAVYNANKVREIMKNHKPYDLGSILLLWRGKILESTAEEYGDPDYSSAGFNLQRAWAYKTLKKHGIAFQMPAPEPDRVAPLRQPGDTNIDRGQLAFYDFESGGQDRTGQQRDFQAKGHTSIRNGVFSSNGKYDSKSGGVFYLKGRGAYKNGFSMSLNFNLARAGENRCSKGIFFSAANRLIDVGTDDGKLFISTSAYGKSGGKSLYADDHYFLKETRVAPNRWHNLVMSVDWSERRLGLLLDGKRLRDIRLSRRFVDMFQKYENSNQGAAFYNFGCGAVLNGQADNLLVYGRTLNGGEMVAVHRKYRRGGGNVAQPNPPDQERLNKDLIRAALKGDAVAAKGAIKAGADVDAKNRGWTPLMYAAYGGHTGVVKLLLKHHADVQVFAGGWDALQLARARGHETIANRLEAANNKPRFYASRRIHLPKHRGGPTAPAAP